MRVVKSEEIKSKLILGLKEFSILAERNQIDYFLGWGNLLGLFRHNGFIPWDDDIDLCLTRTNFDKLMDILNENPNVIPYGFELQTKHTTQPLKINIRSAKLRLKGLDAISYEMNSVGLGDIEKSVPSIDLIPLDQLPKNHAFSIIVHFSIRAFATIRYYSLPESFKVIKSRNFLIRYAFSRLIPRSLQTRINAFIVRLLQRATFQGNYCASLGDLYPHPHIFPGDILFPTQVGTFEGIEIRMPNRPDSYLVSIYGSSYMELPPKQHRRGHWDRISTNTESQSLFQT